MRIDYKKLSMQFETLAMCNDQKADSVQALLDCESVCYQTQLTRMVSVIAYRNRAIAYFNAKDLVDLGSAAGALNAIRTRIDYLDKRIKTVSNDLNRTESVKDIARLFHAVVAMKSLLNTYRQITVILHENMLNAVVMEV